MLTAGGNLQSPGLNGYVDGKKYGKGGKTVSISMLSHSLANIFHYPEKLAKIQRFWEKARAMKYIFCSHPFFFPSLSLEGFCRNGLRQMKN